MTIIKLKKLVFEQPSFRKLGNLCIDFADRITVVAGHNGIGKSTILGLVANGSGLSDAKNQSYLNRAFQANLNEIVHLDYDQEYAINKEQEGTVTQALPSPSIHYDIDGQTLVKRCSITGRTDIRQVRVVPRNDPHKEFLGVDGVFSVGPDAKVPFPTLYLGMTRVLPVGESDPTWVKSAIDKTIHEHDAKFITSFINGVISAQTTESQPKTITTQSIKGTGKTAKHPAYNYNSKCVSLGQDSLSAIATALASFQKLKRDWKDYPGGLLVIDEIDAGFHPHAQERLMKELSRAATNLNLQVVATTHSIRLIETIHPDANPKGEKAKHVDSVVYLTDTTAPRVAPNYSLQDIQNDMSLTIAPEVPTVRAPKLKIYLEDPQAHFFLERLLTRKLKKNVKTKTGRTLLAIPISSGCDNLIGFVKHDSYFRSVIIALDADASLAGLKGKGKNIVKIPGGKAPSGKGLSPEASLHGFITQLAQPGTTYPDARKSLIANKVTTDYLRTYLLSDDTDITKRKSAKAWMVGNLDNIKNWKLVELWIAEHPKEVAAFEELFIAAAIAAHTA
jgi:predicted ATPase